MSVLKRQSKYFNRNDLKNQSITGIVLKSHVMAIQLNGQKYEAGLSVTVKNAFGCRGCRQSRPVKAYVISYRIHVVLQPIS